jgi:hypothetical protein
MSITRNINDIEFEGNEVTDSNIKASRGDVIESHIDHSQATHIRYRIPESA